MEQQVKRPVNFILATGDLSFSGKREEFLQVEAFFDTLLKELGLSRGSTLVRILKESGRLVDFFIDPQRFMDAVANILKYELHRLLVDGIKYERIVAGGPESEWEMMLFKNEELVSYLTALAVDHSLYEYIVYDSEIEPRL